MKCEPVEIIGGGLAGLSLGIALRRRGVPVRLVEATAYPRHRLCGEFLHGRGEEILRALGIEIPPEAPRHGAIVWRNGRDKSLMQRLEAPVRAWSRFALDDRLAQRFQELGGRIEQRRVPPGEAVGAGRVWATGRVRQASPWFGIKAHFRGLKLDAGLEMHLGRRGYLGLTRVEDGWVNACGLFHAAKAAKVPAAQRLPALLDGAALTQLAARLRAAEMRPGSLCGVAGLRLGRQPGSEWSENPELRHPELRVGDARFCPAPLSGTGQSAALEAGWLAAEAVAGWSNGSRSWAEAVAQAQEQLCRAQNRRGQLGLVIHRAALTPVGPGILLTLGRAHLLPLRLLARVVVGKRPG